MEGKTEKKTEKSHPASLVGPFFMAGIGAFAITNYIVFVIFTVMGHTGLNWKSIILLIIFHFFFGMGVWSFYATATTDPGKVPPTWGFYMEDPDQKKRRYCLTCHTFKPERSHHCSVCGRCVLNMDHHCPWVNSCIGFYNRKQFLLLLFYVCLTTFTVICGSLYPVYTIVSALFSEGFESLDFGDILSVISFGLTITVFIVISIFFKGHVDLALKNVTTIENLDIKRGNAANVSDYDVGAYYNWVQIFGRSKEMWWLPYHTEESKPVGDGILWLRKASAYPTDQGTQELLAPPPAPTPASAPQEPTPPAYPAPPSIPTQAPQPAVIPQTAMAPQGYGTSTQYQPQVQYQHQQYGQPQQAPHQLQHQGSGGYYHPNHVNNTAYYDRYAPLYKA